MLEGNEDLEVLGVSPLSVIGSNRYKREIRAVEEIQRLQEEAWRRAMYGGEVWKPKAPGASKGE